MRSNTIFLLAWPLLIILSSCNSNNKRKNNTNDNLNADKQFLGSWKICNSDDWQDTYSIEFDHERNYYRCVEFKTGTLFRLVMNSKKTLSEIDNYGTKWSIEYDEERDQLFVVDLNRSDAENTKILCRK